jgi:hypothetical protein
MGGPNSYSGTLLSATAAGRRGWPKLCRGFAAACWLDAAYDFVKSDAVCASEIDASNGRATAALARKEPFVFVAVDGSSASLTDSQESKGFGSVGTIDAGARGLKVIRTLGAGIGLLDPLSRRGLPAPSPRAGPHPSSLRSLDLRAPYSAAGRPTPSGVRAWRPFAKALGCSRDPLSRRGLPAPPPRSGAPTQARCARLRARRFRLQVGCELESSTRSAPLERWNGRLWCGRRRRRCVDRRPTGGMPSYGRRPVLCDFFWLTRSGAARSSLPLHAEKQRLQGTHDRL